MDVSQDAMIRTVDLRVDYGDFTAVKDLNLHVPKGEIFGLIGPNGAGKTSTFKVLATLQEPTYGDVFVGGVDIAERPQDVHKLLGYMPDLPIVYEELKVWEFLDLFASAYFIPVEKRKQRIDECLELANLTAKRDAFSGTLSRGMRQRLILAKTLLHEPEVMLLDEPAGGLDPMARIELREALRGMAALGKTLVVSSHILTELADFCTSIGIMERGELVIDGAIDDIITQMNPHTLWVMEILSETSKAEACLAGHPHIESCESEGQSVRIRFSGDDEEAADLLAKLIHDGVRVKAFYEDKMDVEDIFLKVGAREVT